MLTVSELINVKGGKQLSHSWARLTSWAMPWELANTTALRSN